MEERVDGDVDIRSGIIVSSAGQRADAHLGLASVLFSRFLGTLVMVSPQRRCRTEGLPMRCPSCGHNNSDQATRCSACGSILPSLEEQSQAPAPASTTANLLNSTAAQGDTTYLSPSASPGGTAEQPHPAIVEPEPMKPGDNPNLREVADTAGKFVSAKQHRIGAFFSAHQRALGIGLAACVIGVLGVVWLVLNLVDAPTYTKIEEDIAARLPSFEYTGGTYGPDLQIPLSNVAVTDRAGTKTPEGMEAGEGVGSAAYGVEAEATYDNGVIRAVHDVGATYVRTDGSWGIVGELAERGTSFTARAGVDEQKVLNNVGTILEAASASGATSLADIYSDGSFSVVGNVFKEAADKNTATNDVTIHCQKDSGFYAYDGNVTAHFAFESGTWTLRSAEANAQASTRAFTPLVGTWGGELSSTTSNGATCYGAKEQPIQVTIDTVGDPSGGRGQVQGTISVLAHYHEKLEKQQDSSKGDTMLERVSFTGTIWAERDEGLGSNLTVECKTTGNAQGDVEFTLVFGTDEDPSAVLARVTSTHSYDEPILWLVPHQTTAKYVDTYTLSRQ